jgi:hypothetical protein
MRFEEIFVFVVAGCVAIYHQRSQQRANNQTQIFIFVVFAQQGYEFQMRRKLEKENEAKRRYFIILLETILF